MLRELNSAEVASVSGGIIIVDGIPQGPQGGGGPDNSAMEGAVMFLSMNSTPMDFGSGMEQQEISENPDAEIVVIGTTRTDPPSSRQEVLFERLHLTGIAGGYGDAEQNADGTWSITFTSLPTDDQARFQANLNAVNSSLSLVMQSESTRIALANAMTDRGINAAQSNLNLLSLYGNYQSLLDSGERTGRTVADFLDWLEGVI